MNSPMAEFRMEKYDNLKLISGNSHPELADGRSISEIFKK